MKVSFNIVGKPHSGKIVATKVLGGFVKFIIACEDGHFRACNVENATIIPKPKKEYLRPLIQN